MLSGVRNGNAAVTKVYAFSHSDAKITASFVRLALASGGALTVSHGHWLYFADGQAVRACDVRVGDMLRSVNGAVESVGGNATMVVDVTQVNAKGLYNPHTTSGDIVVDGVVASCFTDAVDRQTAEALLAPVKWIGTLTLGAKGTAKVIELISDGVAKYAMRWWAFFHWTEIPEVAV